MAGKQGYGDCRTCSSTEIPPAASLGETPRLARGLLVIVHCRSREHAGPDKIGPCASGISRILHLAIFLEQPDDRVLAENDSARYPEFYGGASAVETAALPAQQRIGFRPGPTGMGVQYVGCHEGRYADQPEGFVSMEVRDGRLASGAGHARRPKIRLNRLRCDRQRRRANQ